MQSEVEGNQTIIFTPKQQELRISANDIKLIEDKENGGYHLYVKKNPKVNSILLTEFYEEIIKLLTKNYIDTEYMSLRI